MNTTLIVLLSAILLSPFCMVQAAVQDGYVVKVDSTSVYLDWGAASGVAAGDSFFIFRDGETLRHPVTGKTLGQAEERLADGFIEILKPEFSIGRLSSGASRVRLGDRTRRLASPPPSVAPSAPAAFLASAPIPATPVLLWQSEPLRGEPRGLSAADWNEDGLIDLVLLTSKGPEIWTSTTGETAFLKGEALSTRKENWLMIDASPADGSAPPTVVASMFGEATRRATHRVFLGRASAPAGPSARPGPGFVRRITGPDGRATWSIQDVAIAADFSLAPAVPARCASGRCEPLAGTLSPTEMSSRQLFGFTWGDWDQDGKRESAVLLPNHRIRIDFHRKSWTSEETYGRSLLGFNYPTQIEQSKSIDEAVEVRPRLATLPGSPPTLVVYQNNVRMGMNLGKLSSFKNFTLYGLQWNGSTLQPVWTIDGERYLADFAVWAGADGRQRLALSVREPKASRLKVYTLP